MIPHFKTKPGPAVILVPGAYFFIRREVLATELSGAEQAALCELSLEELSPFPLEQLAWGWQLPASADSLLVFAACIPRLKGEAYDTWPEAQHVFPDFLPFSLARPTAEPVVMYVHDAWLGALLFEDDDPLPKKWTFIGLEGKTEAERKASAEASLPRLYRELTGRVPDAPAAVRIFGLPDIRFSTDGLLEIHHRDAFAEPDSPAPEALKHEVSTGKDGSVLWAADLRDRTFLDKEKKRRRMEGVLWKAFTGSGLAALALLLLCLVYMLGNVLLNQRAARIQAQSPAVTVAEENQLLLGKLEEFSRPPTRPFALLDLLNEERPANIYFRVAFADNTDLLVVEGNATNADEVNRYQQALAASGNFTSAELSEIRSRGGEVQFTLRLRCPPDTLAIERVVEVSDTGEETGNESGEDAASNITNQTVERQTEEGAL